MDKIPVANGRKVKNEVQCPKKCRRPEGHALRTIQDYLGHRDPKHTATRMAAKRFEKLWY